MHSSAPILMCGPEAVFLDAGNTLLHLDYSVMSEVLSRSHPEASPEVLRVAEWSARVRLDGVLAGGVSTESQNIFRRFMTMILEEAGLNLSAESLAGVLDELEDYHQAHNLWSRVHPFAGRVLADLRRLGMKLAVVSNADGEVESVLDRLHLLRSLDVVIDSGVVGFEKPDPRIFLLAAQRVGVAPSAAVHVGDLYAIDVVGARAAGVEPILIDPGSLWPQTDCLKIRDLTAVPDLVRRARAAC